MALFGKKIQRKLRKGRDKLMAQATADIVRGTINAPSQPHQTQEVSVDTDSKPWYLSTSVWGSLIAAVSVVAGKTLPPDKITIYATTASTLVGTAVAVWGRIKASKTIGKKVIR